MADLMSGYKELGKYGINSPFIDMTTGGAKPGYEPPNLDQDTNDLIDAQSGRSNRGAGEFSSELLSGTDQSQQLDSAFGGLIDKSRSLGSDGAAFNDAIINKSRKIYDRDLNQIQRTSNAAGAERRFDSLEMARANQLRRVEAQTDISNMVRKVRSDRIASRNAMISQIMGAAGNFTGQAIAKNQQTSRSDDRNRNRNSDYEIQNKNQGPEFAAKKERINSGTTY